VVATARFYHLDTTATIDSVLTVCPGDEAEDAFEVLERAYGVWAATLVWANDEACLADSVAHGVTWCGPTSEDDYGTQQVHPPWFASIRATIDGGDLVLLLVERLEDGKDKGNVHYLLVLGYQEIVRRRGRNAYSLRLKDPMEGDVLLTGILWDERQAELVTRQASGAVLDRFSILESTHMQGLRAQLQASAKGPNTSDLPLSVPGAVKPTSPAAAPQNGNTVI
jgi:hypothetical protein